MRVAALVTALSCRRQLSVTMAGSDKAKPAKPARQTQATMRVRRLFQTEEVTITVPSASIVGRPSNKPKLTEVTEAVASDAAGPSAAGPSSKRRQPDTLEADPIRVVDVLDDAGSAQEEAGDGDEGGLGGDDEVKKARAEDRRRRKALTATSFLEKGKFAECVACLPVTAVLTVASLARSAKKIFWALVLIEGLVANACYA